MVQSADPRCVSSGPAQVSRLLLGVQSSTDSLQASWQRASGVLDSYRILLVSDSSVIKNESVAADATSTTFHLLRPGALYRAVLTTVRAGLSSRQMVAEGHTSEHNLSPKCAKILELLYLVFLS